MSMKAKSKHQSANACAPAVHRLSLNTDSAPDISSVNAILQKLLRPGMSNEEKCAAIQQLVWRSRYHSPDAIPKHHALADPIVYLNCYCGYICSMDSAVAAALWTAAGYEARAYELGWHTTPEVYYDQGWHNFDVTLWETNRLLKVHEQDGQRRVLGVEEREAGWRMPIGRPQRWDEFDIGHQMDLTLRRGETFTRYWHPTGTTPDYYLPDAGQGPPRDTRGRLHLAHELVPRPFAPLPGRAAYANGEFEFTPDFRSAACLKLMESHTNLTASPQAAGESALHPIKSGEPAWAVFKNHSPWLICGGGLEISGWRQSAADQAGVSISSDNGKSWTKIWEATTEGPFTTRIPLKDAIAGSFDYLVRLDLFAVTEASQIRLHSMRLQTIVNVNPFTLPALSAGNNQITLAVGQQLDSISIYPDLQDPACLRAMDKTENIAVRKPPQYVPWACGLGPIDANKESSLIYRLRTPGDIASVEWGGRFVTFSAVKNKAGGAPVCSNAMDYSFDGSTWHPQPWTHRYARRQPHTEKLQEFHLETIPAIPAGTREVFLRYRFRRTPQPEPQEKMEELLMPSLRVQAFYQPRHQGAALPPLEVVYCWKENGQEKTHREIARQLPHNYNIAVSGTELPQMQWVRLRVLD